MCTVCLTAEVRVLLQGSIPDHLGGYRDEITLRYGDGVCAGGVLIVDGQEEIAMFVRSERKPGATHLRVLDGAGWDRFLSKYAESLGKGPADYQEIMAMLEGEAAGIYDNPPAECEEEVDG